MDYQPAKLVSGFVVIAREPLASLVVPRVSSQSLFDAAGEPAGERLLGFRNVDRNATSARCEREKLTGRKPHYAG
jgi:hypothetical protein